MKCPVGEMAFGEVSIRWNVAGRWSVHGRQNVHSVNRPVDEVSSVDELSMVDEMSIRQSALPPFFELKEKPKENS